MLAMLAMLACNNIEGKWRDYAFNGSQIPANHCWAESDCFLIEQFSMELNEQLNGDFRVQIGREAEHYIYTLPISAEPDGRLWLLSVDNSDYTEIAERWSCDVDGRLMVCSVNAEEYQFRRGGHPN